MNRKLSPQMKVGLFVAFVLLLLAYSTLRISQQSLLPGSTYNIYIVLESASGISLKTPVQIAGVRVGNVSGVGLIENNKARIELEIHKSVQVSENVQARVKSMGFLGDTYIELYQPGAFTTALEDGAVIRSVDNMGDFSSLTNQLSSIAMDVKAITSTMRQMMAGQESPFARSLGNIEEITDAIKSVSVQNEEKLHAIISNFQAISENLNLLIARNFSNINNSMENVDAITGKIRRGEGTLGRLVNDDTTVEKLNESLDSINNLLGSTNRMEVEVGYHAEYLGHTDDFKNYVHLALKPKPDKYFLFEFVDDPAPDTKRTQKITRVTSGGRTTEVVEDIETDERDRFLFSAQFAKKFHDFVLRAGIIESSGGAGIDYTKGPFGLQFSAFDFESDEDERPHLKAMGTLNVTKNLYLLGGVDDFISKEQDPDWFLGAGFKMSDDDVKSLVNLLKVNP